MQFNYFKQDISRCIGKKKVRILTIWMSRIFWGLLMYRLERSLYLLFGNKYKIIRIIFLPIINIINSYSNLDIHFEADIKGGLLILHSSVGIVISGLSNIGKNLTLTGGNVIGARDGCKKGDIIIGDDCFLGANSVVLGPIKLGNNVKIGACACVVKSVEKNNLSLVGVPAREVL